MKWQFFQRNLGFSTRLGDSPSALPTAAQFCPAPWAIVRQMLEMAEIGPEDVVYDLGSGDGRIPILAAQEFGCRAVGIECDPKLFRQSMERSRELKLEDRVRFINQNFFAADLRPATVVTLYLLTAVNGLLQQRLASHLRAGSRVVALDYGVPGWQPERTMAVKSEGNVDYTLQLYRRTSDGAASSAGHKEEGARQLS